MQTTCYKKNSWHYRIATSENMLIPNIFNQTEHWNYDKEHYEKRAPDNSCSYWKAVLSYLTMQLSLMIVGGFCISYAAIFAPLSVIIAFIFGNVAFLHGSTVAFGLIFLVFYGAAIVFALIAAIRHYNLIDKSVIPKPIISVCYKANDTIATIANDINEIYDSLKDKYCKKKIRV